jgi:hypothetical protein
MARIISTITATCIALAWVISATNQANAGIHIGNKHPKAQSIHIGNKHKPAIHTH